MPTTPRNTAGGPVPWDFPSEKFCGIAFIAEAPGGTEVALGHPLVGDSGKVFNGILDDLGIDRAECIVGNVIRWRPVGNKIDLFFTNKRDRAGRPINETLPPKDGSLYLLDEFSEDIRYLYRQIMTRKPAVVVAMGGTALWALTGYSGITVLHGAVYEPIALKDHPNFRLPTKVLPTFHPAFAIRGRREHYRPIIADDIAKALEIAKVNSATNLDHQAAAA